MSYYNINQVRLYFPNLQAWRGEIIQQTFGTQLSDPPPGKNKYLLWNIISYTHHSNIRQREGGPNKRKLSEERDNNREEVAKYKVATGE